MKAVIWTDVVQGIIYLAGVIVVLALVSPFTKLRAT